MKKIILIPLVIIIVGVCLALAGWAFGGLKGIWFDRDGWRLAGAERGELITVDERYSRFENIDLRADFIKNIVIKEGDAFRVRGENYERYGGLDVSLDGDTLKVVAQQRRDGRWPLIDFGFGNLWNETDTWIEVTYPRNAQLGNVYLEADASDIDTSAMDCRDLTIDNDFGDVDVRDVVGDNLLITADAGRVHVTDVDFEKKADIENNFGDVKLLNVNASDLYADLDSGDLEAENVTAETMDIKNDFGKVVLDGAEADDITMTLSSGDLSGSDIRAGDLNAENNFGKVTFDRLRFTGICEIDVDSGKADISLSMNEDDLSYQVDADAGSVKIGGKSSSDSVSRNASGTNAKLIVTSDFGDIDVRFAA